MENGNKSFERITERDRNWRFYFSKALEKKKEVD